MKDKPYDLELSLPAGDAGQNGECEQIERFYSLESGRYWRVVSAPDENGPEVDQVLLLESIRWVDDQPHTIIIRSHPADDRLSRYRYRVDDFLDHFVFEPDGEAIRERELQEAQADIQAAQARLQAAQSSRQAIANAMREDGFLPPSPGTGLSAPKGFLITHVPQP
jgi:hypothetical protein